MPTRFDGDYIQHQGSIVRQSYAGSMRISPRRVVGTQQKLHVTALPPRLKAFMSLSLSVGSISESASTVCSCSEAKYRNLLVHGPPSIMAGLTHLFRNVFFFQTKYEIVNLMKTYKFFTGCTKKGFIPIKIIKKEKKYDYKKLFFGCT